MKLNAKLTKVLSTKIEKIGGNQAIKLEANKKHCWKD